MKVLKPVAAVPPGLDQLELAKGAPRVALAKGKANIFIDGNPIVFTGAIDHIKGDPTTGAAVVVTDWKDSAIAWGVFNSVSMFRVRIMQLDREVRVDSSAALDVVKVVRRRIAAAAQLRQDMGLPSDQTTVYRLVNSEGDRLSGLIVDVLGDHIVAISSAAWAHIHQHAIIEALQSATGLSHVIWRSDASMLKLEGITLPKLGSASASEGDNTRSKEQGPADKEGEDDSTSGTTDAAQPGEAAFSADEGTTRLGPSEREDTGLEASSARTSGDVVICEEGVRYFADPNGQKTGFYSDQRESRLFLRSCVRGKRVLDLCCYSGGFALNAALHGALEVTGVDSSQSAIELARRNAELNNVSHRCTFHARGIEAFMEDAFAKGELYDVIMLDPPKLAPSRKMLDRAIIKYTSLNTAAMRILKPDGLLMTCSCSGAMTQSGKFQDVVAGAARKLRRPVTLLRDAGAGACHVQSMHYREGNYLTNLLVKIGDPSG